MYTVQFKTLGTATVVRCLCVCVFVCPGVIIILQINYILFVLYMY